MAKRITGIEKNKTSRSKKTAKRLAQKAEMLRVKALKPAERKKYYAEQK
jgi:uncharacterized membrane protein YqiK